MLQWEDFITNKHIKMVIILQYGNHFYIIKAVGMKGSENYVPYNIN